MASVAHAYLKITPSLQGLGRHLRDQVREAEGQAPKVSLSAEVKTALLREQLHVAAREGDQIAIRLVAELDSEPAETRFAALKRRLDGQNITLKVVLDKSVGASIRGLSDVDSRMRSATGAIALHSGAVGLATLKYGAMAAGAGQAGTALGGLGSVAATASGSLLAVPAAGLAAVAILQTLKLGISGFSDALKVLQLLHVVCPPHVTASARNTRLDQLPRQHRRVRFLDQPVHDRLRERRRLRIHLTVRLACPLVIDDPVPVAQRASPQPFHCASLDTPAGPLADLLRLPLRVDGVLGG
ncbi:hypothetical protein ACFORH_41820, partial [Amycolatopsis roodepoortensis]